LGTYSYEQSRIVLEKIVSYFYLPFHFFKRINYIKNLYNFGLLQDFLVEQSSQGNFVPQGRPNILIKAIGRRGHPGRVCAVGKRVGI